MKSNDADENLPGVFIEFQIVLSRTASMHLHLRKGGLTMYSCLIWTEHVPLSESVTNERVVKDLI